MASIYGKKLKLSVFGESHGEAIGVVIDGFPAGMKVDFDAIAAMMKRRAPAARTSHSRLCRPSAARATDREYCRACPTDIQTDSRSAR